MENSFVQLLQTTIHLTFPLAANKIGTGLYTPQTERGCRGPQFGQRSASPSALAHMARSLTCMNNILIKV